MGCWSSGGGPTSFWAPALTPEGVLGRHFQQRQRRSRAASDFLSSGPVTDIGGILMFFMYRDRFKV